MRSGGVGVYLGLGFRVQGFWVEEVLGVWSLWVLGLGPLFHGTFLGHFQVGSYRYGSLIESEGLYTL